MKGNLSASAANKKRLTESVPARHAMSEHRQYERLLEVFKPGSLERITDKLALYLQKATGKQVEYKLSQVMRRSRGLKTYGVIYKVKPGSTQVRFNFDNQSGEIPASIDVILDYTADSPIVNIPVGDSTVSGRGPVLYKSLPSLTAVLASVTKLGRRSPFLVPNSAEATKLAQLGSGARLLTASERAAIEPVASPGARAAVGAFNSALTQTRDLKQCLSDLEKGIQKLLSGGRNLLIAYGDAGAGKTYTVKKMLKQLAPGSFEFIGEVPSGSSFYATLYDYNGMTMVFDDNFDKVVNDPSAIGYIKSATNTQFDARTVARNTQKEVRSTIVGQDISIPNRFDFTGEVIILTNKPLDELFDPADLPAIMSRAIRVEFNVDPDSVLNYIREIFRMIRPVTRQGKITLPDDEQQHIFNWFIDTASKKMFKSQSVGKGLVTIRAFETCITLWITKKIQGWSEEQWQAECLQDAY